MVLFPGGKSPEKMDGHTGHPCASAYDENVAARSAINNPSVRRETGMGYPVRGSGYGIGRTAAFVLVLFILLVIILRAVCY